MRLRGLKWGRKMFVIGGPLSGRWLYRSQLGKGFWERHRESEWAIRQDREYPSFEAGDYRTFAIVNPLSNEQALDWLLNEYAAEPGRGAVPIGGFCSRERASLPIYWHRYGSCQEGDHHTFPALLSEPDFSDDYGATAANTVCESATYSARAFCVSGVRRLLWVEHRLTTTAAFNQLLANFHQDRARHE